MNSANKSYEIKGVLGNYALEQSTKILTLTRMPIRIQFSQAGVINLNTWFVDLFCDFANKLNKKARANTKNNRNIFTISALRYELVDESVNIKKGTLWFLGFAMLATFQIVFSFFCAENIQFFGFGVYRFAVFPFLEFSFKITEEKLTVFRIWYLLLGLSS